MTTTKEPRTIQEKFRELVGALFTICDIAESLSKDQALTPEHRAVASELHNRARDVVLRTLKNNRELIFGDKE